jgi:hypothetical protein
MGLPLDEKDGALEPTSPTQLGPIPHCLGTDRDESNEDERRAKRLECTRSVGYKDDEPEAIEREEGCNNHHRRLVFF